MPELELIVYWTHYLHPAAQLDVHTKKHAVTGALKLGVSLSEIVYLP
jgi:hypothetical protein